MSTIVVHNDPPTPIPPETPPALPQETKETKETKMPQENPSETVAYLTGQLTALSAESTKKIEALQEMVQTIDSTIKTLQEDVSDLRGKVYAMERLMEEAKEEISVSQAIPVTIEPENGAEDDAKIPSPTRPNMLRKVLLGR